MALEILRMPIGQQNEAVIIIYNAVRKDRLDKQVELNEKALQMQAHNENLSKAMSGGKMTNGNNVEQD